MNFTNEPVPPDALPNWRQIELAPVSPRYAPYRVLATLARWLVVAMLLWLIPYLAGPPGAAAAVLPAGAVAMGLALSVLAGVEANRRAWALREHDVIYRSGLLVRRTVVLPFRRVQHVETVSGPLERAFGLLRLTCYTAGGFSADLVIAGLDAPTAKRVRQYLLGRIADLEAPAAVPSAGEVTAND